MSSNFENRWAFLKLAIKDKEPDPDPASTTTTDPAIVTDSEKGPSFDPFLLQRKFHLTDNRTKIHVAGVRHL